MTVRAVKSLYTMRLQSNYKTASFKEGIFRVLIGNETVLDVHNFYKFSSYSTVNGSTGFSMLKLFCCLFLYL